MRHESPGVDTEVPFKIRVATEFDRRCDYAIRAWVDLDSDGKRASGDLYSDQRYSVLPDQLERVITIKVAQH